MFYFASVCVLVLTYGGTKMQTGTNKSQQMWKNWTEVKKIKLKRN